MNGQCARVLEVLADGQPHTVTEIHRLAGTMRLNSRVAELRNHLKERGETIVCTRAGGNGPDSYVYTLVSSTEPAGSPAGSEDLTSSPSAPGHLGDDSCPGAPLSDELQLELGWIDEELGRGIELDSPNARNRRAALRRQREILEPSDPDWSDFDANAEFAREIL